MCNSSELLQFNYTTNLRQQLTYQVIDTVQKLMKKAQSCCC